MSDQTSIPPRPKDETPSEKIPAPGPHAKPELTNPDATPGAGSLPDETQTGDADGGAG